MAVRTFWWVTFFLPVFFFACQPKDTKVTTKDTPISGELTIAVDESLSPLIDAEMATFQGIYSEAHITAKYLTENEVINAFLSDSLRQVIITRPLTTKEIQYFASQKRQVTTTKIAIDAIALIVNNTNADTVLTYQQLLSIMRGEIHHWSQLNTGSQASGINVVFDNSNSSTVRLLKDSLAQVNKLPANCFAVNSNPKVIDYVSSHANSMGLIGVSWISDRDDSLTMSFLNKIKVVSISNSKAEKEKIEFYKPFQAEMKLKQYPLCRNIYVISSESWAGLGSGFASFLASDRGQRIVQKSGLLPATMPVRIIQLGDDSRFKQQMQQE
ncbi:MAG: substrate-binding domain-containing protein [Bacteroidota bacterium]